MTDVALVGRLLGEYHERRIAPSQVRVLAGSEHQARTSYLVTLPEGGQQLIRAVRADEPAAVLGQSGLADSVADWLTGRARTLAMLAAAAYPAPRPVRTRTGELIAVAGPWLSWATTYPAGAPVQPTLTQLRQVGTALGHLHSVAALPGGDRIGDGPPGLASWHPAATVVASLARLDGVTAGLPSDWRPMHAEIRAVLAAVAEAAAAVPETIVHGDVWARNAVQSGPVGVTLMDWEAGGRGLAVLDLGSALVECHLDADLPDDEPQRWLITPSPDRIAALAEGYRAVRALSAAELDLLPAAVRYVPAVLGSVHFELAAAGVTGPAMAARLARLQNRLAVADEVAAIATASLSG